MRCVVLIGTVARLSGMSKDGVRHYEELGLIFSTARHAGSKVYRDYASDTVELIEKVRQAQSLGFALKEIGPLLKAYAEHPMSTDEAIIFLETRRRVVRKKIADLKKIENFIAKKLAGYRLADENTA